MTKKSKSQTKKNESGKIISEKITNSKGRIVWREGREGRRGNYQAQLFVDGKKKRYSLGTANIEVARQKAAEIVQQMKADALAEQARLDALGGQEPLELVKAFAIWERLPKQKSQNADTVQLYKTRWTDFITWLAAKFPKVEYMHDVTPDHVNRFSLEISTRGGWTRPVRRPISGRTVWGYLQSVQYVFSRFVGVYGVQKSPAAGIQKPPQNSGHEARDIFTMEQLQKINTEASKPVWELFLVALNTGLRLGDICQLEWGTHIDLEAGTIYKVTNKKGTPVYFPIMPALLDWLKEREQTGLYVFPEYAAKYEANAGNISDMVNAELHRLGMVKKNRRATDTRSQKDIAAGKQVIVDEPRKRNKLGLHACRHTFCTAAAEAGVPMPVLQAWAGHLSPEVTQIYTNHMNLASAERHAHKLPQLFKSERYLSVSPQGSRTVVINPVVIETPQQAPKDLNGAIMDVLGDSGTDAEKLAAIAALTKATAVA